MSRVVPAPALPVTLAVAAPVAHVTTAIAVSRPCLLQNAPLFIARPRDPNPPLNAAPPRRQLRVSNHPRKKRKNPRKKTNQNIPALCDCLAIKYPLEAFYILAICINFCSFVLSGPSPEFKELFFNF